MKRLLQRLGILRERRFPCPCCGYLVFAEPPGSDQICPVCEWQDDVSQLRFPDMQGAANFSLSLIEAQQQALVRLQNGTADPVTSRLAQGLPRDPAWRPFDPIRDRLDDEPPGQEAQPYYPQDSQVLYYWRPGYWKRRRR